MKKHSAVSIQYPSIVITGRRNLDLCMSLPGFQEKLEHLNAEC
jgi:hypothetical protein